MMSHWFQQFSCCCHFVLYQHVPTQLSQLPTSCRNELVIAASFQFSCMTPKKVESASIETRAWGLSGITSSSSSSWCSCTIPVTVRCYQRRCMIVNIEKTDMKCFSVLVFCAAVLLGINSVSWTLLKGWTATFSKTYSSIWCSENSRGMMQSDMSIQSLTWVQWVVLIHLTSCLMLYALFIIMLPVKS